MPSAFRRACLGAVLFAIAAGPAQAFTFDWPVPGYATVTVDVLKRDRAMRYQYRLSTERSLDGDEIIVRSRSFETLVFDGQQVDTPEMKAAVAPLTAAAGATPALRIERDGTFDGFDGDMTQVFDEMGRLVAGDEEASKVLEAMRSSPKMREAVAVKVADQWAIWVANWIGLDLREGETVNDSSVVPAFGETVQQSTTMTYEGPSDACAACVSLRWTGTVGGPEFRRGWEGIMRSLGRQAGDAGGLNVFLKSVESIRRVVTIKVETDPKTLQPWVVSRDTTMFMQIGDGPPAQQVERTTYRFDWD